MGQNILVVNDTEEILQIFEDILSPEGYDVVLYSYAINDMDTIVSIKPDLVILDLVFGQEKSGWQMLQKMKMTRATATIPVIICTAATREVREIEGYLQAKGVNVVPKPFDIDDLLNAIKHALQAHAHAAAIAETRKENNEAATHGEKRPDDGDGNGNGNGEASSS